MLIWKYLYYRNLFNPGESGWKFRFWYFRTKWKQSESLIEYRKNQIFCSCLNIYFLYLEILPILIVISIPEFISFSAPLITWDNGEKAIYSVMNESLAASCWQLATNCWFSVGFSKFFKNDIKPNFWNFILHIPDVKKSLPRKIFLLNPDIFKSKVKMKKSRIWRMK